MGQARLHDQGRGDDQLSVQSASLVARRHGFGLADDAPLVFTAPATLAGGGDVVAVNATDSAQRMLSAQVTVHVTPTCTASETCKDGLKCLGGYCLPGSNVAGGLGADCTENGRASPGRARPMATTHAPPRVRRG